MGAATLERLEVLLAAAYSDRAEPILHEVRLWLDAARAGAAGACDLCGESRRGELRIRLGPEPPRVSIDTGRGLALCEPCLETGERRLRRTLEKRAQVNPEMAMAEIRRVLSDDPDLLAQIESGFAGAHGLPRAGGPGRCLACQTGHRLLAIGGARGLSMPASDASGLCQDCLRLAWWATGSAWQPFRAERMVERGSEGGFIRKDEEHPLGSRITLEEGTTHAPFAITCGVYGNMVHTRFFGSREEGEREYDRMRPHLGAIVASARAAGEDTYPLGVWISDFVDRFP